MQDMRKGFCALCDHDRIIETWPADQMNSGATVNLAVAETMTWKGVQVHGSLIAYVCQRCGYTQWFTSRVEEIPIGPTHRTSIISGQR